MMISQMNQSQLLHWIDMVSFAVVEITEYLDTHPDDEEALKYFNHYADLRRTALRAYAQIILRLPSTPQILIITGVGHRIHGHGKEVTVNVEL